MAVAAESRGQQPGQQEQGVQRNVKLSIPPTPTDAKDGNSTVTRASGPQLSCEKFHGIDTPQNAAVYA
jgi:hypothetical protein